MCFECFDTNRRGKFTAFANLLFYSMQHRNKAGKKRPNIVHNHGKKEKKKLNIFVYDLARHLLWFFFLSLSGRSSAHTSTKDKLYV